MNDACGDAPHAMRPERAANVRLVLQQAPREALVGRVRFGFDFEHAHRPAALRGHDRFIIPIGAFDKTNGDRRASLPSAIEQPFEIAFAFFSMERDSQAVALAQFRRTREPDEQFERQIFQLRVLHVEVDEYAEISSAP